MFVFQWSDRFCCIWQLEALNILTCWYWSCLSTGYSLTIINTALYRGNWTINQLLLIALQYLTPLIPNPGTGYDTSSSHRRHLLSLDVVFSVRSSKTPLSKIFFNLNSSICHDYSCEVHSQLLVTSLTSHGVGRFMYHFCDIYIYIYIVQRDTQCGFTK